MKIKKNLKFTIKKINGLYFGVSKIVEVHLKKVFLMF